MALGGGFGPALRRSFALGAGAVAAPAANWWEAGGAPTPIVVYQPKGASSLAASYTNLVAPGTHDAAPGVEPSWASETGWGFGGSHYLNTIAAGASTWSYLVRVSSVSSNGYMFGVHYSQEVAIAHEWGWNYFYNCAYSGEFAQWVEAGVFAMADRGGYLNGTQLTTMPAAGGAPPANQMAIGAKRVWDSVSNFLTGNIQLFAIWDTSTDHATWMPAVMAAAALI